jgi:predicted nucleotidyltransferase
MVTLSDIKQKREDILRIAYSHGADQVRLFGSIARGTAGPFSDLDILVRMKPDSSLLDRIALMQDLEDLLHIKVDVVNEKALHKAIRQTVLQEGIPL